MSRPDARKRSRHLRPLPDALLPRATLLALLASQTLWTAGCGGGPDLAAGTTVEVRVPSGVTARAVGERLEDAGLIDHPRLFSLYVRMKGAQSDLKAGHYSLTAGSSWGELLDAIRRGDVITHPLTIPEGFTLREAAPRIAEFAGVPADSVLSMLQDTALARKLGVPGPTLEGYLFPETYRFSEDLDVRVLVETMVEKYHEFWGPAERRLADSLGMNEHEIVTLASIVEEEARRSDERAVIAGVYLNRLRIGMLLQADPTVQYALGKPKERLLFRHIDEVADNPYNTYTHAGLPPGPIASPGEASLRAVLEPADVPYLFFVAQADGSHVFSRTQREHVNATNRIRREAARAAAKNEGDGGEDDGDEGEP